MQGEPLRVLVIGAGLGGIALTLALVQSKANVHVTLLERDESQSSRNQGLVIGLRQESIDILTKRLGYKALRNLFDKDGPKDVAILHEGNILMNGSGWLIVNFDGIKTSSLVDRCALRNALIEYVPENSNRVTIKYGKHFSRYEENQKTVTAYFEDGTSEIGDILVAADGDRSKVRLQRCPELEPVELGFWNTAGSISIDQIMNSKYAEFLAKSLVLEKSKTALVRLYGKGGASLLSFNYLSKGSEVRLLWALSMPSSMAENCGIISVTDKALLREKASLIAKETLSEDVSSIISLTDETDLLVGYEMTSVKLNELKLNPLSKQPTSRVTLLGDAAHKTTTNAGLGATAAFKDAINLADRIISCTSRKDLDRMLRNYEKKMVGDATQVVYASVSNTEQIHEIDPKKAARALRGMRMFGSVLSFFSSSIDFFTWSK